VLVTGWRPSDKRNIWSAAIYRRFIVVPFQQKIQASFADQPTERQSAAEAAHSKPPKSFAFGSPHCYRFSTSGELSMQRLFMLSLGGAIGTAARYLINGLVSEHQARHLPWATVFPLGTMIVNITGCFVIGVIAAVSDPSLGRGGIKPEWRDFLMVGICGGYTTFSSFGLQTLHLARDGEWFWAGVNVIGSNLLCLIGVYLGWVCGRFLQAKLHGGSL
jgi:fluoride exporter